VPNEKPADLYRFSGFFVVWGYADQLWGWLAREGGLTAGLSLVDVHRSKALQKCLMPSRHLLTSQSLAFFLHAEKP
jgi:hypothetical protein